MIEKPYHYWVFRYHANDEIAIIVRCREVFLTATFREIIEDSHLVAGNICVDPEIDSYWEGWHTALAFDLCPCMEVYYDTPDTLAWKRVTV